MAILAMSWPANLNNPVAAAHVTSSSEEYSDAL
jgi:hypothetical protein